MTTAPVWGGRGRCKSEDEHKRKLIFDNRASASVASSPTVVATIEQIAIVATARLALAMA